MNHRGFLPGHENLLADPLACQLGSPDMSSPTQPCSSCFFNFWGDDSSFAWLLTISFPWTLGFTVEDRVLRMPDFRASIMAISAAIQGRYLALLCLVLWIMLHSWGQCGGCFVWLNQSIEKRSCRLMFWWYSSVSASESLAANPDRKLVGRKKLSKCLTPIQTRKLNQAAITFFFFPGRAGFFTSHSESPLFYVVWPIVQERNVSPLMWKLWGQINPPQGGCSAPGQGPLWAAALQCSITSFDRDPLPVNK